MIAVIPARGGSKRIPKKNLVDFNGISLLGRAINIAKASKLIDRVLVSTDCTEIAELATQSGAEVPFLRTKEQSTDRATIGDAVVEMISNLNRREKSSIENVIIVQTTTPFTLASDIDKAISLFIKEKFDSVVSVTPHHTPIEAVFEVDESGRLANCIQTKYSGEILVTQQQLYKERFVINGAFVVAKIQRLRHDPNYFYKNRNVGSIQIPLERGIDIDTYLDLEFARYIDKKNKNMTERQGEHE